MRLALHIVLLFKLFWALIASASAQTDSAICEAEMITAAQHFNVPLGVLYAVGLTETGRKSSLQPYALNIGGKAVFAQSEQEALRNFYAARKRGIKLIDLGCMQINHHYHGHNFVSTKAMLNPATNVAYAAKFLADLYQREGSWTLAVARYHAGPNNNPAQKRYVCRVLHNMVASGFGNWTPPARAFCLSNQG